MDTSLGDLVSLAKNTFKHALNSVMPERLLNDIIEIKDKELIVHNKFGEGNDVHYDLSEIKNIIIVGAGKANQQLCVGMFDILHKSEIIKSINIKGYVNFPQNQEKFDCPPDYNITFMEATHPLPDHSTFDSTRKQLSAIDESDDGTLLICLFSGGGSSLFELPYQSDNNENSGISLKDLQKTNEILLMSGASIHEINTVRKHLSQVKGGNLAKYAMKNQRIKHILGLYLSDVVGNDISSVASGPTCPDLTTFEDCYNISMKYSIFDKFPKSVQDRIQDGMKNSSFETPKPGDALFNKVDNILIGSSDTSALAAKEYLQQNGISTVNIFSNNLDGEASEFGSKLPQLIENFSKQFLNAENNKAAFIGTGEFTVTIKGNGVGGRNQEMLLSFLIQLCKESSFSLKDLNFVVLSCAFDGIEGNSNVTGALVDSSSINRLKNIVNDDLEKYLISKLCNNDSFTVLNSLNDTISTSGYTGTNVNDMTLIIVAKK